MQPFIAEKRAEIADLCRKHHVRRLSIFGSAVRDDFNPATSDVDVIVEFSPVPDGTYVSNITALRNELESHFDRKVDLLTWKSIKNAYLLREIEHDQETLYAA
jgi:predicted nucleotidyltransferase